MAHLGSWGPEYQPCPARQAKGSRRKKNKCDDSWALANESWSERSQNKHLVPTRTRGWSDGERGNVQRSHHGGKGLQHEQHHSERQISCLIMLQEIPGHLLLSRVQRLRVEQEEGTGNAAAAAPPAQVWGHNPCPGVCLSSGSPTGPQVSLVFWAMCFSLSRLA